MRDEDKTKEQLINELVELRQQCAELKAAETKHNQAEEVLRESEERYRHLYEQSPIGVGLATPDGKVISCNKAIEAITGYSIEELKRMNVSDIYENPGDRKALIEAINRYGEVVNFPVRLKRKEGTLIDCLLTISRFHHFEGEDIFQTICIDITDRERAEEALRNQTIRNELILQTAMDGFCVIDLEGKILEANHALSIISAYSQEELVGMNIRDFEAVETPEETTRHIKKVMREGSDRFETRHRRKDGEIVDLEVSTNFVEVGEEKFLFAFFRDITERKRADQALLEREKELEINSRNLADVNTALRVLLKKREEDKAELEEKVFYNVKELVVPYVEKLKKSLLNERQKAYVSIMESNLKDIIAPFSRRLSSLYLDLTATEVEVANLVKHGWATKEIAEFLNLSNHTIDTHRRNIRRKMGIRSKKANLRAQLLSFQ